MIAKTIFLAIILSTPNVIIHGNIDMVNDSNYISKPITVYVSGSIDESSAKKFANDMRSAHETGQPIIPIIIRSYGGGLYSLFSMIDTINRAKVPVATIIEGKAMSAAVALFTCGTEGMRYASPNSTMMIHDASSSTRGKVKEIEADTEETTRLNDLMLQTMSTNIGKRKNYFRNIIHSRGHADWYFTPEEAMKHGIVNHIGVPELEVHVSVRTILK